MESVVFLDKQNQPSHLINTPQLHDGRWMWFKISNQVHVEDIKLLLKIKQAPKTSSK